MNRIIHSTLGILALVGILTQTQTLQAGVATPSGVFTISLASGNNFIATPFARSEEGVGTITSQSGTILTVAPISGPVSYGLNAYGSAAAEPYVLVVS